MRFKDVLVDEKLKTQLVALADTNRISHAQLFLGKEGTHSFALAIAYAQYICCEDKHDGDSCGKCHSCVMFEKLQHPDLHLIFPNCNALHVKKDSDSKQFTNVFRNFVIANNYHLAYNEWVQELKGKGDNNLLSINIRDCANIISQNSIRSYENGYKIYILWMAEKLHYSAAPKLLKTLEEPENKTLFILLAESSDAILPTILSRTQLVKIPPLKEEVIKQHLIDEEGLNESEAADIAAISEGSFTRARTLAKDNAELHHLLTCYNIFVKSAVSMARLNTGDPQTTLDKVDYPNLIKTIDELVKNGKETQKRFLTYLSNMFRNELLLHQSANTLVKTTGEERTVLGEFIQYFTVKNAGPLNKECDLAIRHIERNVNSAIVFTDLFFKIAQHIAKR